MAAREDGGQMRIATFNVQNLRLRSGSGGRARLDGARDGDLPADTGPEAAALDDADRRLTARVIADTDADVICLQEVFDRATLDYFHDVYLRATGVAPWPYRICLPGNDGRGRDLALLSRRPPSDVVSHAALKPGDLGLDVPAGVSPDTPVFRRDCLLVRIGRLTLFLCHFKAPYPDAGAAWRVRNLEARAVRALVERRFDISRDALWLIAGDLNEPAREAAEGRAIAPLLGEFTVDLMKRLPEGERWSYEVPDDGLAARPDVLLASPALAQGWPEARPVILREGLSREVAHHRGERLPGVGQHRPHASDHAAVVVAFEGL